MVTLQIREEGNEEANLVEIGLEYEMDGERPIPGSLQVESSFFFECKACTLQFSVPYSVCLSACKACLVAKLLYN